LKQEASCRVMQPHLRAMRDAISMQSACNHNVISMQSASQRGGERPRGACDEGRNQHAINMQSTCNQHAISMQSAYLRQPVRLGTLAIRFDEMRCNQSSPEPFELQSDVPASNEGRQSACN
jgi:hypothetical protein